jgi:hypothetical protein
VMELPEAIVSVLREEGRPVHWTVIQDQALRRGYIDPFTQTDVRKRLLAALSDLVASGAVVRSGKGVYAIADAP